MQYASASGYLAGTLSVTFQAAIWWSKSILRQLSEETGLKVSALALSALLVSVTLPVIAAEELTGSIESGAFVLPLQAHTLTPLALTSLRLVPPIRGRLAFQISVVEIVSLTITGLG